MAVRLSQVDVLKDSKEGGGVEAKDAGAGAGAGAVNDPNDLIEDSGVGAMKAEALLSLSPPVVLVDLDAIIDWQLGIIEAWNEGRFEKCRVEATLPPLPSTEAPQTLHEGCDVSIKTNFSFETVSADSAFETSSSDETVNSTLADDAGTLASSQSASTFQIGSGKSLEETSCELEAPQVTRCAFECEETKSDYSPHMHLCRNTWNMSDLENDPDAPFVPDPNEVYNLLDLSANQHFLASKSNLEPFSEVPEVRMRKCHGVIQCEPQSFGPVVERIIHQQHFFCNLPARAGALESLKQMLLSGINVLIHFTPLTSSTLSAQEGRAQGLDWVGLHLGRPWVERVVLADSQCSVRFDLLIDDKCHDQSAVGKAENHILLQTPYNRDICDQFQHVAHTLLWPQWPNVILPLLVSLRKPPVPHSLRLSPNSAESLRSASDDLASASGWEDECHPERLLQSTATLASAQDLKVLQSAMHRERRTDDRSSIHDADSKWSAFAACFQKAAKERAATKRHARTIEPHESTSESCGTSELDASEELSKSPSDPEQCCNNPNDVYAMCKKCSERQLCVGIPLASDIDIEDVFEGVPENCIMKDILNTKRQARAVEGRNKTKDVEGSLNCLGFQRCLDAPKFAHPNPYTEAPTETELE